ncbi:MAG: DUF4402 domain-containing protein [Sphingomicrobium sp.]
MKLLLNVTAVAALALTATPALAAPVSPNQNATATARIVKPLTLSWVQNLNLGTVLLSGAGAWSGAVVSVSQAGALTCANPNVVCSGAVQAARYNVRGTNNQLVYITAPNVTLTSANNPLDTLLMTVSNPGSVMLTNSGAPGVDFNLGGSITVSSTTGDGVYSGTFNVTVDY